MRLSSLTDYAVVLMSAAARHHGEARFHAGSLADETGLPLPTVQKLVGKLSAANLLISARGAGGGLSLAKPAAEITLADIIEAIEGPIALTACVETGRHDCGMEHMCIVQPHWPVVNTAVRGALAAVNLASLASSVIPAKAGIHEHNPLEFGSSLGTGLPMDSRLRGNDGLEQFA